tara:strand:+ start:165 stop:344 length:180 start_codon:yes stop_codon:yes gene_type:complete
VAHHPVGQPDHLFALVVGQAVMLVAQAVMLVNLHHAVLHEALDYPNHHTEQASVASHPL